MIYLIIILTIPLICIFSLFILRLSDSKLLLVVLVGILASTLLSQYQFKLIYIADYFTILLIIKFLLNIYFKKVLFNIVDQVFIIIIALLLFLVFVSWILNLYSLLSLLWGLRNAFKFAAFYLFTSSSLSLNQKTFKNIVNVVLIWTIIQAPIMIYQFIKTNGDGDKIVGTFTENGTGVLSEFLTFSVIICTVLIVKRKLSKTLFITIILISLLGCVIAEIKMGFISIALALLVIFLMEGKKIYKNSLRIILISLFFIFGYKWLIILYPRHDFLSLDFLNSYLSEGNYDSKGSINRFNFFPTIMYIFNGSIATLLLGKGLGNASPSNFSFIIGDFYKEFGYFYHFDYFILPYYLVELGLIGLFIYLFLQLIFPFVVAIVYRKIVVLNKIILTMAIIQIIYIPYNINLIHYSISSLYWILIGLLVQYGKKNTKNIKIGL